MMIDMNMVPMIDDVLYNDNNVYDMANLIVDMFDHNILSLDNVHKLKILLDNVQYEHKVHNDIQNSLLVIRLILFFLNKTFF